MDMLSVPNSTASNEGFVSALINGAFVKHENMVLRRIFGPKRDEVTGEGRKLRNEGLKDLYCSLNIVQVYRVLGGKT